LQPSKFCEGEGDSTSEKRAGQFSIFGAIEENAAANFGMEFRVWGGGGKGL
jgi:hypothetical protein